MDVVQIGGGYPEFRLITKIQTDPILFLFVECNCLGICRHISLLQTGLCMEMTVKAVVAKEWRLVSYGKSLTTQSG